MASAVTFLTPDAEAATTPQIPTTPSINELNVDTSMCYPASSMGAHVSACDRTDYRVKGDVALWGTFGYELDPNELSAEERGQVKKQVDEYHKYYNLTHFGDLYRLKSPYEDGYRCAWSFVAEDKSEALATVVTMRARTKPLRRAASSSFICSPFLPLITGARSCIFVPSGSSMILSTI